jgi:hypothetical protein
VSGRFDKPDFGRAENALHLVEVIVKDIEDVELLRKLQEQMKTIMELTSYRMKGQ